MTGAIVVGVDVGGTKIAAGLVDRGGAIVRSLRVATPAKSGGIAVVSAIADVVHELLSEVDGEAVGGVGVSTGGIVDHDSGRILAATDLIAGWADVALADELATRLDLPVTVDNDGNAFAVAAHRYGAARGADSAICVAVGTGIGGGLVLDGRIRRGPHFLAGELGHLPAGGDRRCSCGVIGHLESVAAGPAMSAAYAAATGVVADLREIAAAAESGDAVAESVIRAGATALGRAMGGLAVVLDVDLVVVGGGVASLGFTYLDSIQEAVTAEVPHNHKVHVRPTALGPDAAVIGAASLVTPPAAIHPH